MTVRVDLISGIGWLLFHELHEQYKEIPGDEILQLFEQTYHCKVGYSFTKSTGVIKSMKHFYMEFTPEQFTMFQLKYGDRHQEIVFMTKEWFSDN